MTRVPRSASATRPSQHLIHAAFFANRRDSRPGCSPVNRPQPPENTSQFHANDKEELSQKKRRAFGAGLLAGTETEVIRLCPTFPLFPARQAEILAQLANLSCKEKPMKPD